MVERGILAAPPAGKVFHLERWNPPPELTEVIERAWSVRWELQRSEEQEVLPFPCVNWAFGDHQPGVHGPLTRRFVARLEGRGEVLGIKFRPAGFFGMLPVNFTMDRLVDRVLKTEELWPDAVALAQRAPPRGAPDREALFSWVRDRHRGITEQAREVNRIVDLVQADSSLNRVAMISARTGRSVRSLERAFRAYVGLSPKLVIRRFRLQEAASYLASDHKRDLAGLALALGYCDQAHFARDFKSVVGDSPARFAARCAARAMT